MAIWATMWEDAIFEFVRKSFERESISDRLKKPIYDCPICMTMWYGSALYWLIWGNSVSEWLIVTVAAMGLNTVFVKLFPDD